MADLAKIRARRAEIASERKKLDQEESELAVAERVLTRLSGPKVGGGLNERRRPKQKAGKLTQADYVTMTLRETNTPWVESAAELHTLIKQMHGVDIKKSTYQPLLSYLKNEKIIKRDGQRIALSERV